jgi:hypothetical protein
MSARRADVRERMARVREVLLRDWDPLGVGSNPELADEYETWLPRIMRAVEEGRSEREIAEILRDCERELEVGSAKTELAASKLAQLHAGAV